MYTGGTIGTLSLKNRLIRSATCDYQASENGTITPQILDIYRKLAEGGIGMIISGLMAVTSDAVGTKGQMILYNEESISEVAKLANVVHDADQDCRIIAQLCHPGRQITHEHNTAICVGPSDVASPLLLKRATELTEDEVVVIISAFVVAIIRAQKAGFDGAQLHAAHGYLLSSFLSPYTNRRTDRFGGDVKRRACIIREIIQEARKEVNDFPILIKLNCEDHVLGGITKDNFVELVTEIAKTGVDAIEVSGAIWDCLVRSEEELGFIPVPIPEARTRIEDPQKQSYYYKNVADLDLPVPIILVGGHRNVELMEDILKLGPIDFLSLSRPLICEPDLPNRWLMGIGSERSGCVSCNACVLFKEEFGCALRRRHLHKAEFEIGFANGWRASFK